MVMDLDLSDDGDLTFILFFSFVYFNKNTNFNQNSCDQCEK